MKAVRIAALTIVSVIVLLSIFGSVLPGCDYSRQDRQSISSGASREHWLGTDALGRDRLIRVLHGTRISMSLAPAAATVSLLLGIAFGAVPGFVGGASERLAKRLIDLLLSAPWLFLLLIVRASLPLNLSPTASATVTFAMPGLLGRVCRRGS